MPRRSDIGSLFVSLELEIAKFRDGLTRAERLAQQRSAKMSRSFDTAKRAVLGLGTAFAALGVGAFVRNTLASADAVAKLSKQTGFGVEAVQRLQFAAEQSGVAQEKFNTGIQAFAKRIGELKQNTGGLFTFLQKYDRQLIETLKNTNSTGDAFKVFADRFSQVKESSTQAALGAAGFSRTAGTEMTVLLSQGSRAIEELGDQLNNVFTAEQVAQAERANDVWNELSKNVENLAAQITIAVAGPMESFGNFLKEVTNDLSSLNKEAEQPIFANLEQNISSANAQLENLSARLDNLRDDSLLGTVARLVEFDTSAEELEEQIASLTSEIENWQGAIKGTTADVDELIKNTELFGSLEEKLAVTTRKATEGLKKQTKALTIKDKEFDAVNLAVLELIESEELFGTKTAIAANEMKKFREAMAAKELNRDIETITRNFELFGVGVDTLDTDIEDLARNTELFGGKVRELDTEIINVSESLQSRLQTALADFFERGLRDFDDFLNTLKNSAIRIAAEIAAAFAVKKLFGGLFNISLGGGGGGAGGIVGGVVGGGLKKLFGIGAGATTSSGAGGALPAVVGGGVLSGGAVTGGGALAFTGTNAQLAALASEGAGLSGVGGAGAAGLLSGPAAGVPIVAAMAALYHLGKGNRRSTDEVFRRLQSGGIGFSPIAGGISGARDPIVGGDYGFLRGIGADKAQSLLGSVRVGEEIQEWSIAVSEFNDQIALGGEHYEALVQAIKDGGETIIGSQENIQKRVEAAMGRMSDFTVGAFRSIDLMSVQVSDAIKDGFVSAAELSAMGIHGLGGMAADVFRGIVMAAHEAMRATAEIGHVVGGAAPRIGNIPNITPPPPPSASFDIGDLAAQHGGSFVVNGRGGVDQNNLRVSNRERITVETPGQQGRQIELLGAILKQLTRQNADMARLIAR